MDPVRFELTPTDYVSDVLSFGLNLQIINCYNDFGLPRRFLHYGPVYR